MSGGVLRPFGVGLGCLAVAIVGLVLADRPGFPAQTVFRVGAVVAVMLLGALPRVSLAADGLAAADFRVRMAGTATPAEIAFRFRTARRAMGSAAVGVGAAAAGWAVWLAWLGTPGDRLLALLLGVSLAVRSRLFDGNWAAPALLLIGVATALLAGLRLAGAHGSLPELVPTVAGVATGAVLGTVQAALSWQGDLRRRLLHWLEATSVIATICVAAVSLGVVTAARTVIG